MTSKIRDEMGAVMHGQLVNWKTLRSPSMKAIVTKANKHNATEVFLNPDVFYKKMLFKRFFSKMQNQVFKMRHLSREIMGQ